MEECGVPGDACIAFTGIDNTYGHLHAAVSAMETAANGVDLAPRDFLLNTQRQVDARCVCE
jgi:hypothetical protein